MAPHCTGVPLGNKEDGEAAEPIGARVLIASLLGLAAACWPVRSERECGAPARIGRIDLLAPRGRLDGAPSAIRWSTTQRVVRVRIRVRNDAGDLLLERLTDDGRSSGIALDARERALWSQSRSCRIEIDGMAADGELVALGDPVAAWIASAEDDRPR